MRSNEELEPDAMGSHPALKPPPDRLYGRSRGHKLRPRQEVLLDVTLERLRFRPEMAAEPLAAFSSFVSWPGLTRPSTSSATEPSKEVAATSLWLEIGFGGGEHALAQVAAHPEVALIACEVFENGICSLLSRLVPEGEEATAALPPNLRIWPDDGRVLLRALPDACLDRLFLLFPDPWPKNRHAKRRFVHPAQLPEVARVLKQGAIWRVASDDPTYQAWVADVMAAQRLFDAPAPATARPDDWPPTRYEAKALRAGRSPLYWTFTRR